MQIEMTIKGLMVDPITNMPIVILRDKDGQRVLPIWVGVFEANAIALQIENVTPPRPMTHDLLNNVIHDLRADIQKIVVSDLKDNTFYALIYLIDRRGSHCRSTRARVTPSPWRCAPGRRSSSKTRSSTAPSQWTSPRRSRTPSGCRNGSRAWTPIRWANTRCNLPSVRAPYILGAYGESSLTLPPHFLQWRRRARPPRVLVSPLEGIQS